MTVDRELITREVTRAGEPPAYSWVPSGLPGYEPQTLDWKNLSKERRLADARKLYAEAVYGPGIPLRVVIGHVRREVRQKTAEAIAEQWKEALGVQAIIALDKASDAADKPDSSFGHLLSQAWNADYADPNAFLQIWTSDSTDNPSGYQNQAYDALIRQAALERNPGERAHLLERAEHILLNDLPIIPIHEYVIKKMVRPNVIGYSPNILGFAYSKDISFSDTASTARR
jgi:oligopeptide transport system substrate-binding protein